MALGFEEARSKESSLEGAAMDFFRFRRADGAEGARQDLSPGAAATLRWQPGLAAPPASLPFSRSRTILYLHSPHRCRHGELHRSHGFIAPSHDAISRWSAVPEL